MSATGGSRISATLREKEQVTPLELFFDLVFVLALTQCAALMADVPSWHRGSRRRCSSSACSGGRGWATPG